MQRLGKVSISVLVALVISALRYAHALEAFGISNTADENDLSSYQTLNNTTGALGNEVFCNFGETLVPISERDTYINAVTAARELALRDGNGFEGAREYSYAGARSMYIHMGSGIRGDQPIKRKWALFGLVQIVSALTERPDGFRSVKCLVHVSDDGHALIDFQPANGAHDDIINPQDPINHPSNIKTSFPETEITDPPPIILLNLLIQPTFSPTLISEKGFYIALLSGLQEMGPHENTDRVRICSYRSDRNDLNMAVERIHGLRPPYAQDIINMLYMFMQIALANAVRTGYYQEMSGLVSRWSESRMGSKLAAFAFWTGAVGDRMKVEGAAALSEVGGKAVAVN